MYALKPVYNSISPFDSNVLQTSMYPMKPYYSDIMNNFANDQQQSSISSFYPLPPMRYIKQFTDINVRNRCTPLPPKPFIPGSYLMFGQNITIDDTIIRSLESQGLRRLYPREYDHKRELKKINASILVNFLDLIDVLIRCPDTQKREEKCNDLQLLFITVRLFFPTDHHLILCIFHTDAPFNK